MFAGAAADLEEAPRLEPVIGRPLEDELDVAVVVPLGLDGVVQLRMLGVEAFVRHRFHPSPPVRTPTAPFRPGVRGHRR